MEEKERARKLADDWESFWDAIGKADSIYRIPDRAWEEINDRVNELYGDEMRDIIITHRGVEWFDTACMYDLDEWVEVDGLAQALYESRG
jgi:hypothetical protein